MSATRIILICVGTLLACVPCRTLAQAPLPANNPLKALESRLGNWVADGYADDNVQIKAQMSCEWVLGQHFQQQRYLGFGPSPEGKLLKFELLEYAGWDVASESLKSWSFDSDGAVSQSRLKSSEDGVISWLEETTPVSTLEDGRSKGYMIIRDGEGKPVWSFRNVRKVASLPNSDVSQYQPAGETVSSIEELPAMMKTMVGHWSGEAHIAGAEQAIPVTSERSILFGHCFLQDIMTIRFANKTPLIIHMVTASGGQDQKARVWIFFSDGRRSEGQMERHDDDSITWNMKDYSTTDRKTNSTTARISLRGDTSVIQQLDQDGNSQVNMTLLRVSK